MMKLIEKNTSAGARRATGLLGITLFALALSSAGAAAFPINIIQEKDSQDKNYDAAASKRFVGTWKGKESPRDIADNILTFKIEGRRLTGSIRSTLIHYEPGTGVGRIAEERYHPLHILTLEATTLTAKLIWKRESGGKIQDLETLFKVTLVSDDEIKVEGTGEPSTYNGLVLKREK